MDGAVRTSGVRVAEGQEKDGADPGGRGNGQRQGGSAAKGRERRRLVSNKRAWEREGVLARGYAVRE